MPENEQALAPETLVSPAMAVKSLDDDTFELCLYKFTNEGRKDLTHEFFDDGTDFVDTAYPMAGRLLFHHGLDGDLSIHPIGAITSVERRPGDGIYGKGLINFADPYKAYLKTLNMPSDWYAKQAALADDYELMLKMLKRQGKLAGSGGALPQGVVVEDNGHIKRWPQIEYTLTPAPAEPEYTRLKSIKSLTPISLRELSANEASADSDIETNESNLSKDEKGIKSTMDMEQLSSFINEVVVRLIEALRGESTGVNPDEVGDAVTKEAVTDMSSDPEMMKGLTPEAVEAKVNEIAAAKIQDAVKAALAKQETARNSVKSAIEAANKSFVPNGRAPMGGFTAKDLAAPNFEVNNLKYAHLNAQDMLLGHEILMSEVPEVMRRRIKSNEVLSDEYLQNMVGKTMKMVDSHKFASAYDQMYVKSVMKANEIDTTANTGFGPEWVGQVWSTQIWEKARVQRVWEALESHGMQVYEVPQGAATMNISTESTDPTVYSYPQSADLDATSRPTVNVLTTPFATGTVALTPGPLGLASAYSVILEEDSVIPIAQQLNYQIDQKMQETIEQVIFNGDTTTTANTNINLIDGTPGTGTSRPYYLASNGILKYPLVTNTALKRDANGSLALDDYRKTIALLAPQFQTRLRNLLWAADPYVHVTSMGLPELATDDVRQRYATITSGVINNLFGIDYVQSGFILKANNAGKVPAAGGTLGRFALVFAPYWALGYKRHIKIETGYDVLAQTKVVVGTMRLGVVNRGADAAAVTYDIGLS